MIANRFREPCNFPGMRRSNHSDARNGIHGPATSLVGSRVRTSPLGFVPTPGPEGPP